MYNDYRAYLIYDSKKKNYLYHHGIKGQHWGVKNGPPYPLGSDVSTGKSLRKTKYRNSNPQDYNVKQGSAKKSIAKALGLLAFSAVLLPLGFVSPGIIQESFFEIKRAISSLDAKSKLEKLNKRRSSLKKDEKTGLYLKDREYSEKEDMAEVNPEFKNYDSNTKNNCVLCSYTYEIRRRGFDAVANKSGVGYSSNELRDVFPKSSINEVSSKYSTINERIDNINNYRNGYKDRKFAKETLSQLEKLPNGSRGILRMQWGSVLSGHAVAYEIKNGQLIIRDCQSNEIFKGNSAEKLLSRTVSVSYERLDNVAYNPKKLKEVCN